MLKLHNQQTPEEELAWIRAELQRLQVGLAARAGHAEGRWLGSQPDRACKAHLLGPHACLLPGYPQVENAELKKKLAAAESRK
jgi:hypothetical protein